jgi:hypothetical protein
MMLNRAPFLYISCGLHYFESLEEPKQRVWIHPLLYLQLYSFEANVDLPLITSPLVVWMALGYPLESLAQHQLDRCSQQGLS